MATQLSYRDINITFKNHPVTDDLVVSKDASAIKQAIVNLLLTNKGERLMNPTYGSDIRSYLFEPMDFGTANQIKNNIRDTSAGALPLKVSAILTDAFGDVTDLGVYPSCFARDTTLSRRVAESKNNSFTTMLVLNAV